MKYIILLFTAFLIISCGDDAKTTNITTEAIYPSDNSFLNNAGDMRVTAGTENFWTLIDNQANIIETKTYEFNDKSYSLPKVSDERYQIMLEALSIDGEIVGRGISNIIDVNDLEAKYPIFITPVNQSISLLSTETSIDDSVKNLSGHTVTNLPDGRVLIWGGKDTSGYTSKVFIYYPGKLATIQLAANSQRAFHTATLYYLDSTNKKHPRVLIAGGQNSSGYIGKAEIFNPENDTIEEIADQIVSAKINQSSVVTPSGFIYLFGGNSLNGAQIEYSDDIISFNTFKNTFSQTAKLPRAVENTTATYLGGDKVVVVGGNDASNVYKNVYLFNSGNINESGELGSLTNARTLHQAILYNSTVYIIGGFSSHTGDNFSNPIREVESVDSLGVSSSTLCSLSEGRGRFTANLINANTIIVTGGDSGDKTPIKNSEIVELRSKSCMPSTKVIPLNEPRYSSKSVLTSNGLTLIVGGTRTNPSSSATPIEVITVIP